MPIADDWAQAQLALPLASPLRTAAFERAWRLWGAYQRERRKPLTPSRTVLHLRKLEGLDERTAIATIERAVESRWATLWPIDPRTIGGAAAKPPGSPPRGFRENLTL